MLECPVRGYHPYATSRPVAVLTGGTSGIGRVAAEALVERGFSLTVLARNLEAATQLQRSVMSTEPRGELSVHHCDLAKLDSVARSGQTLAKQLPQIHLLVHNAGCCSKKRIHSLDGREHTWTVNQLAPFVLTQALEPSLVRAAPARVVVVGSQAHHRGRLHLGDPHAQVRSYHGYRQYAFSKLANLMWTRALHERLAPQGVRAYAYHPGVVNTNIAHDMDGAFGLFFRIARPLLRTPAQGAHTLITLACRPQLPEPPHRYFIDDKPAPVSMRAQSQAMTKALWRVCEQEAQLVVSSHTRRSA